MGNGRDLLVGGGGKDGRDCESAISWLEEAGKEAAAGAAPGSGVVAERVANLGVTVRFFV